MSLRFFFDQCVPAEFGRILRQNGHDVVNLREILHIRALDSEVIAKAQELGRILVSLNGDFSDIVAYPPARYGGIIALQLHNHPEVIPQLADRLIAFLAKQTDESYYREKLFLVEVHRIRVRH